MADFPELSPGLSGTIQYQVDDVSTARQLGSGSVDVLATPELVRLMEVASVAAVADHLPPGLTTVGVAINVEHIAPTPMGLGVTVRANLVQVQGRRMKFELVAHDDVEEIGGLAQTPEFPDGVGAFVSIELRPVLC
jgi:fluoroacetyl-CoA thioesterase